MEASDSDLLLTRLSNEYDRIQHMGYCHIRSVYLDYSMYLSVSKNIALLPIPFKRLFYSIFIREMTITSRVITYDETITDEERLQQLFHVNEIIHNASNRLYTLCLDKPAVDEAALWEAIRYQVSKSVGIAGHVAQGVNRSYSSVQRLQADAESS